MSLTAHIQDLAAAQAGHISHLRQHLHRYPELSFEEFATQAYVGNELKRLKIPFGAAAGTGLVGEIQGQKGHGVTIALRADLDALPIQEKNTAPYASVNAGVMHACGHDVHTACLLGAAAILQRCRNKFAGTIRLLFQPGEEKLPGGASLMIADGALKNPRPAAVLGQHVFPSLETGKVGFRPGLYMASADEIYLTVRGKGGHGATPHETVDPIAITAQIITATQQLISRQTDPTLPAVLTFGRIESNGGATNVIPDAVRLMGTLRTLNEAWRAELQQRLHILVTGIAQAMGASVDVRINKGYPFLHNDETLTHQAIHSAKSYLGEDQVVELPIRMTGEDFAFYTHHAPGCFYRLGTANAARGITSPVHTNTFDVDESCLTTGPGLMAYLALEQLRIHKAE